MVILVAIMFSSCSGDIKYKNQGYLHPAMSKLHNIQVIKVDVYNTVYERIYYYSYKDSAYYTCIIPVIYKEDFKEGNIIK
jgi:hypothetical protein